MRRIKRMVAWKMAAVALLTMTTITVTPPIAYAPNDAIIYAAESGPESIQSAPPIVAPPIEIQPTQSPQFETFEVTAYTAGYESTQKKRGEVGYGVSADGTHVYDGMIACSADVPFGTQIYIPYFDRTFTCHDRGSAIHAGHIDVYMPSLRDARNFGRQKLPVKIIE